MLLANKLSYTVIVVTQNQKDALQEAFEVLGGLATYLLAVSPPNQTGAENPVVGIAEKTTLLQQDVFTILKQNGEIPGLHNFPNDQDFNSP